MFLDKIAFMAELATRGHASNLNFRAVAADIMFNLYRDKPLKKKLDMLEMFQIGGHPRVLAEIDPTKLGRRLSLF